MQSEELTQTRSESSQLEALVRLKNAWNHLLGNSTWTSSHKGSNVVVRISNGDGRPSFAGTDDPKNQLLTVAGNDSSGTNGRLALP